VNRVPTFFVPVFAIMLSLPAWPKQKENAALESKASSKRIDQREFYGPVVAANNRFAIKLAKAAYEMSSKENVLTAPATLSYAFALMLNGSTGVGREQIAEVFDLKDISLDRLNQGNEALRSIRRSHFARRPPSNMRTSLHAREFDWLVGEDGRSFQPYSMSGALWVENGTFTRQFISVNTKSYGYTLFPHRPTAASVNQWVSLKTHGKFKDVVRDVAQDDFILATEVHFKSRWVEPFSPAETHSAEFTLLSGTKKQVQMMPRHLVGSQYLKGPNFQAVKLPFYDAAMVVVLPDEDSTLQTFVDSLTPDAWQTWESQFSEHDGYLELPRFEIKQERNSTAVLEQMGLKLPFSDLTTFIPLVGSKEGAMLTRVQEGISIKVDETGAEITSYALGVGAVVGICGNCQPTIPFRMIVNRPFFFWIVDTRTNQTLYMGTIVEP